MGTEALITIFSREVYMRYALVLCFALLPLSLAHADSAFERQLEKDWKQQNRTRVPLATASPEQDAAGGCDGVINGAFGFHTESEDHPWWQVDLGSEQSLSSARIYNRGGNGLESRASRLRVLLSSDGETFSEAYAHDGTPFLGHNDQNPLNVDLTGHAARFLRIQLPEKSYLHLDEVEVFAEESERNIALNQAASQSSVSQWSSQADAGDSPVATVSQILVKGFLLAENLRTQGVRVNSEMETLRGIAARAEGRKKPGRALREEALWAVRLLAMKNPLLDFDEILFVKRKPTMFPHVSDQYYGWFSRGGGGVCILSDFKGEAPKTRCLTDDWDEGSFLRPALSYDGAKVLFAYAKHYPYLSDVENKLDKDALPEDAFYHIFEMDLDGKNARKLTHGRYDDFDGRYLPNGDIVFLSTRKGTALQANRASAQLSLAANQADSYVRCGGGSQRPVAVYTLHRIDADGNDLQAISAFENFEWTPAIGHDGRVFYARWDYIDRFNGHYMSLWSTNPDGTNAQLVFGNYTTHPQCIFEARPIPNSNKMIFTATAHHSITGGSLVLLDRSKGSEYDAPMTRLTPEVCFPESEGTPRSYYANPWPLSEEHYLVSWSDKPLPRHAYMGDDDPQNPPNGTGLYLYDAFGNLNLLYRDPDISSMNPIPIRSRKKPHVLPDQVDWNLAQEGSFLIQNIYEGLDGVETGSIKRLRVVGVPPKVQPTMNTPRLGVSAEDPGKFVLGTVPVAEDGSAHFRVPSGVPVFFQALDEDGMAVQTMRSLTYAQPGHTLSCVGCHEARDAAPPTGKALAAEQPPSKITPGPTGTWPLRFDALVQPLLDEQCVSCHQEESTEENAAELTLTADASYDNLLNFSEKDLHNLVFEKDRSIVGDTPSRNSLLWKLLNQDGGHYKVRLSKEDQERLITWMDTYAHQQGAFSEEQEIELVALRSDMKPLLETR
jgi:hypothetical protein